MTLTSIKIISLVFVVLFIGLAFLCLWLANEHVKKFEFMDKWAMQGRQMVTLFYPGPSSGIKPGMRNIVLRGEKPFSALVCMRWKLFGRDFGIDPYGFVQSDSMGVATISTFYGWGPVEFIFVVNTDLKANPVKASSTEADQACTATETFPPHKVQEWGWYKG